MLDWENGEQREVRLKFKMNTRDLRLELEGSTLKEPGNCTEGPEKMLLTVSEASNPSFHWEVGVWTEVLEHLYWKIKTLVWA